MLLSSCSRIDNAGGDTTGSSVTDGTLHMIVIKFSEGAIELEFYRAEDDLGKSWKHEKHTQLDESITTHSPSVSAVRDGSVQDNTLSCFFYGYRNLDRTAYTFNISLEDYSITEPIDILEDFDIQVDWRYDKRLPATDEQTQVINTENGTYVTFVYNFKYLEGTEYFHIVKIGKDNKVTVLASDSFKSMQDKYLTMTEGIDGKIYVCLPSGRHTYVIDTVTDEVTYTEMTPFLTEDLFTRQVDIVTDPAAGNEYYISILDSDGFKVTSNLIDPESFFFKVKNAVKYTTEREAIGYIDNVRTLGDDRGGFYMVGTRVMTAEDLEGKLEYNGHVHNINDAVALFYLSSLADSTEIKCIDVHLPYEDEGCEGIWSKVDVNDVYLDNSGKLNIIYSDCHFDYDDNDRPGNAELEKNTLKYYLAVYEDGELISREELALSGLTSESSVRIAEASDGTVYLITVNLQRDYKLISFGFYPEGEEAKLSVYFEGENSWNLALSKQLGDFAAEGLFVTEVKDDTAECLVYASDRDIYHTSIRFAPKG